MVLIPGHNPIRCGVVLLLSLVLATESASAQKPRLSDLWTLRPALHQAYASGDYQRAIEIGLKLIEITPHDPVVSYDLACVYALSGERDLAVQWLRRSADDGFQDAARARNDPDLASVRKSAGFLEAIDIIERAPELFEQRALAGEPVVFLPPDFDGKTPLPLVVVMHGYGGRPEGVARAWRDAARQVGAILVAPRSIHRVGSGFQWGAVEDADFILTTTLQRIRKRYKVDPRRVVLSGFSQGGYMAFCLGTLHAGEFAGVIPMAALYDPMFAPARRLPAEERARYYLMVGGRDRVVESNRLAASAYREQGYEVRLKVFLNLGHKWPPDRVEELRKALDFALQR